MSNIKKTVQLSKLDNPKQPKPRKDTGAKAVRFIKKAIAYTVLVISAAYGFRMALENIQTMYAFVITGVVMVLLVIALVED